MLRHYLRGLLRIIILEKVSALVSLQCISGFTREIWAT